MEKGYTAIFLMTIAFVFAIEMKNIELKNEIQTSKENLENTLHKAEEFKALSKKWGKSSVKETILETKEKLKEASISYSYSSSGNVGSFNFKNLNQTEAKTVLKEILSDSLKINRIEIEKTPEKKLNIKVKIWER